MITAPALAAVGSDAHVLLVEDDRRIAAAVGLVLEEQGCHDAFAAFAAAPPDIVLLDVMLPGVSGVDVCHALRQRSEVPIIMVTARGDTSDVVAGLEAGADDYVVKPFSPAELMARMAAALRRAQVRVPTTAVFGELEILPKEGRARRRGEDLRLTKTELRLLCELAFSKPRVLSREALLASVWGYDYFGDARLVDVHVRRLRAKVEDDRADPQRIVTVRGLGYRFDG